MIVTTKDLYQPTMNLLLEGGLKRGHKTGWKSLDEIYSVNPGDLTIVTGIPNSGKSEWLDALAVNTAKQSKFTWCVFSPENHPMELHVSKMLEKIVGKPFTDGPTKPMSIEEADKGLHWMYEHFHFIDQHLDGLTPDNVIALLADWAVVQPEKMPRAAIVDPWNELDISRGNDSEPEFINKTLSKFRRFAREFKVALFIVAHPTKLMKDKDGKYPVPTPYDISGAAHFRNKADVCITVHRDSSNPTGNTEIHIQKVRFKHIGKVGVVEMKWDRVTGRYSEVMGSYEDVRG